MMDYPIKQNVCCTSIKDELRRRNAELDHLIEEAKEKQGELAMLQDMRKQFEVLHSYGLALMGEEIFHDVKILD